MIERPILFSGAMVRAILQDQKQQTRRVVKPQPQISDHGHLAGAWLSKPLDGLLLPKVEDIVIHCPYGSAGARLWVRETWRVFGGREYEYQQEQQAVKYRADLLDAVEYLQAEWRPSIFMPRWACRLVLDVTAVRVERLQDISEADAKAEGITTPAYPPGVEPATFALAYSHLWDSLNAARGFGWATNPWVWVISFRRADALKVAA